jgi:predicted membrane-bound mannosyltransferase
VLAAAGSAVALFERRKNRSAILVGAWGFGLLLAYSLIRYKTPWLVLSFLVPLCLAAGYGVQALGRLGWARLLAVLAASAAGLYVVQELGDPWRAGVGLGWLVLAVCLAALWARTPREGGAWGWRTPALGLGAAAVAVCLWQTAVLNFREYDNESYPYVYSHTRREALEMVRQVKALGARAGRKPRVIIASPEYWPLPWYLKDVQVDGYGSGVASSYDPLTVDAVIGRQSDRATENQVPQLSAALGANYQQGGTYPLRPGVQLVLFVRRDLLQ